MKVSNLLVSLETAPRRQHDKKKAATAWRGGSHYKPARIISSVEIGQFVSLLVMN